MPFGLNVASFADAVAKISAKTPIGTALRSTQLDDTALAFREAGMFSARVESVRLLSDMQRGVLDALQGNRTPGGAGMDRGRFISNMRKLANELGVGYLGKSEITNMQGPARLGLIYDMLTRQAHGYARWKMGQDTDSFNVFPAQRLIRIASRKEPRDWQERWDNAAVEVAYEGVASRGMVAMKDSPIWTALSRFGTPWPPFDYGSGMGVQDVNRDIAEDYGLVEPGVELEPHGEADFAEQLEASVKNIPDELLHILQQSGLAVNGGRVRYIPHTRMELGIDPADPFFRPIDQVRKRLELAGEIADPEGRKVVFSHQAAKHWGRPDARGSNKTPADVDGRAVHLDLATRAVKEPDHHGFDANGKRVYLRTEGRYAVKVIVGKDGNVETIIPTSLPNQVRKWINGLR